MKRHPKEAMTMNNRIALIARHIAPSPFQSMPCHITTAICRNQGNLENLEKVHGLRIEDNVRLALSKGLPVVALESTIISHGMPYPQNLTTAREVEDVVRKNGAVPATIAIIGGVPCIGLTSVELQHLARMGTQVLKTARRDISHVVAKKADGATTVSATMCFAAMVGIQVFVTGGIGGVHRHGETTLDISSDLTELGRTPVTVVSAGVKSILDIPRTLEYLETQGVPVVGYQTDEFPAFFTRKSGCKVSAVANNASECAAIIDSSARLSLGSGILIAVPIPEEYTPLAEPINTAIKQALQECREQNINGNAVTPFLLKRVNEITGGASLAANIALVKNNARVGAEVAASLCAVSMAHK